MTDLDRDDTSDGWRAFSDVEDPVERAEIERAIRKRLVRAARPDPTLVERYGPWIYSTGDYERVKRGKAP